MKLRFLRTGPVVATAVAVAALSFTVPSAAHAMEKVGCTPTPDGCDWSGGGGIPIPPDPWIPDASTGDGTPPPGGYNNPHHPGHPSPGGGWRLVSYDALTRKGTYRAPSEPAPDPRLLKGVTNCVLDSTDDLLMTCDVPHAKIDSVGAGFLGCASSDGSIPTDPKYIVAPNMSVTYGVTTTAGSDGDSEVTLHLNGYKIDPNWPATGPDGWVDISKPGDSTQVYLSPWLHKGDVSQFNVHLIEDDTNAPSQVSVAFDEDGAQATTTATVLR